MPSSLSDDVVRSGDLQPLEDHPDVAAYDLQHPSQPAPDQPVTGHDDHPWTTVYAGGIAAQETGPLVWVDLFPDGLNGPPDHVVNIVLSWSGSRRGRIQVEATHVTRSLAARTLLSLNPRPQTAAELRQALCLAGLR